MKAAVVYYSRSGVTKKIAEKIQAKFHADMIFVEPEKKYGSFPSAIIRVIREKKGKKAPAAKTAKAFLTVEMSMGQMIEDVRLAIDCLRPVHFCGRTGGMIPTPGEIEAKAEEIARDF